MRMSAGGAAHAGVAKQSNCVAPPGLGTAFAAYPGLTALPGSPTRAVFARWGGLGYPLDAPTALGYQATGNMVRLESH